MFHLPLGNGRMKKEDYLYRVMATHTWVRFSGARLGCPELSARLLPQLRRMDSSASGAGALAGEPLPGSLMEAELALLRGLEPLLRSCLLPL